MADNDDLASYDDISGALYRLSGAGFLWSRSMRTLRMTEDYRRGMGPVTKAGLDSAVARLIAKEIGDGSGFIPIPSKLGDMARAEGKTT